MTLRPDIPTARDMMTTKLVTFRPQMPVTEAIRLLLRHSISGAPVVGEDGRLVGHFSEFDCMRALANQPYFEDHDEEQLVGGLMSGTEHTIPPELDLFGVAQAFVERRVRRLPVLDGDKLVGQVSRRDVLRALDKLVSKLHDRTEYPDYPTGRKPIP